jgi:hypothetical protein
MNKYETFSFTETALMQLLNSIACSVAATTSQNDAFAGSAGPASLLVQ